MTSLKHLIAILMLWPAVALACSGWVIGFRGNHGQFDHKAFEQYAHWRGYCHQWFEWNHIDAALTFINQINTPYQLYGFSRGAGSVRQILLKTQRKPEFVITTGAFRTTNVNFDFFGVPYHNYFDRSGRGQTSPGIFVPIEHGKIQQFAIDHMKASAQ